MSTSSAVSLTNLLASIQHLGSAQLSSRIKALHQRENEAISDLVLHLAELASRGYYRELGYSSMFMYLTKGLGYSEGAAQRRIMAARCLKEQPELYFKLREGTLSLCALSELSKLQPNKRADLLPLAQGKSKREVEKLVARELPPVALKRDTLRVQRVLLPAQTNEPLRRQQAGTSPVVPSPCSSEYVSQASSPTSAEASTETSIESPPPVAVTPCAMPQVQECYTLTLHVDQEFVELLQQAKELCGEHKPAKALARVLKSYLNRHSPAQRALRRAQRAAARTKMQAGQPPAEALQPAQEAATEENVSARPTECELPGRSSICNSAQASASFQSKGPARSRHIPQVKTLVPATFGYFSSLEASTASPH